MYPNIRPAINPNSAEMIWSIVKIDFMLLFILSPQVIVNKAAWALPSYCSRIQVAVTIGVFYGLN